MAQQQNQTPIIIAPPKGVVDKVTNLAIGAVLLGVAWWGGKKIIQNIRKNSTEKKLADSLEVQQATALRNAMNPSGISWMMNIDTTDDAAILQTAKEIKDLKTVQEAYRKLYNDSLIDDLKSEMKPDNYTQFLHIIGLSSGTVKLSVDVSKNRMVVSKSNVNIRKTPSAYGTPTTDKLLIFKKSNIITTVPPNRTIGYTTGETKRDTDNNVIFLEVKKVAADTGKTITVWVAASQVKTLTPEEWKKEKYSGVVINEKDLAGIGLIQEELLTLSQTPIYNEQFKFIKQAPKGIILGYPIMELNDNKGNVYIKFTTIQDKERWVNKKYVKTIYQ